MWLFKLAKPFISKILKETRQKRNVVDIIPNLVKDSTYNIDNAK